MKKAILLSIIAVCILSISSCKKEALQIPTAQQQTSSTTKSSLTVVKLSGWVLQPTWYYYSQSSKTFSIGNLGLVVSGTNTGTAETIVLVQERDISNNPLIEHSFRVTSKGNNAITISPMISAKSIVVTTIRSGSSGTVVGLIVVNSKY